MLDDDWFARAEPLAHALCGAAAAGRLEAAVVLLRHKRSLLDMTVDSPFADLWLTGVQHVTRCRPMQVGGVGQCRPVQVGGGSVGCAVTEWCGSMADSGY